MRRFALNPSWRRNVSIYPISVWFRVYCGRFENPIKLNSYCFIRIKILNGGLSAIKTHKIMFKPTPV